MAMIASAEIVGAAADIVALGAVLWCLLKWVLRFCTPLFYTLASTVALPLLTKSSLSPAKCFVFML